MNDNHDDLLRQLRALGTQEPAPSLRTRTLAATQSTLQRPPASFASRWAYEIALAAAGCVLALGLQWDAAPPANPVNPSPPTWERSLDLSPSLQAYLDFRLAAAEKTTVGPGARLHSNDPS